MQMLYDSRAVKSPGKKPKKKKELRKLGTKNKQKPVYEIYE